MQDARNPESLHFSHLQSPLSNPYSQGLLSRPKPGKRSQLQKAMACGQITMCFNLLEHLHFQRRAADGPFAAAAGEALFERARRDWGLLRKDPYAFADGRPHISPSLPDPVAPAPANA